MKTNWRLPKGVDDLLPPAAWELETLRRRVLDLFVGWGFDYIEPPIIEYLDALLVGSGEDLDLQTLKVVDQVSGKQLGVRADMTSQAVRVDAHSRIKEGVQRLCYAGPVVFANPRIAQTSRVPFKAGAEIFGSNSLRADGEVMSLMLAAVQSAGVENPVLLLGHMGIYQSLLASVQADAQTDKKTDKIDEAELFAAVQRKSQSDVEALLPDTECAHMIASLPLLMGGKDIIGTAQRELDGAPIGVTTALEQLAELVELIEHDHPGIKVRIDVSELSGYGYHNGPVFAVYHPLHGRALAQGGRYDGVGAAFGRGRGATGFDMDLKALLTQSEAEEVIFAPFVASAERPEQVAFLQALRAQGLRVVQALTQEELPPLECWRQVSKLDGVWQVLEINRD